MIMPHSLLDVPLRLECGAASRWENESPGSLSGKGTLEMVGRGWGLTCGESPDGGCLYLPEALLSSQCSAPWRQGWWGDGPVRLLEPLRAGGR